MRIWSVARTEEEINTNMNNEVSDTEDGLKSYWKFNAGEGTTLYDHSGNQNHGTIYGATWVENVYGCTDPCLENYNPEANWDDGSCGEFVGCPDNGDYSLSFDGENDYVDLPTVISDGNSSFTVSFWMKLNDLSQNNAVLARTSNTGNVWGFSWHTQTNSSHFISRDDDGSNYHNYSDFSPNQDEWYYISMQREAGVAKRLYVNGAPYYEIDDPNSYLTLPDLRIGGAENNINYADMEFDNLQIWDRALSESEIFTYMHTEPVDN